MITYLAQYIINSLKKDAPDREFSVLYKQREKIGELDIFFFYYNFFASCMVSFQAFSSPAEKEERVIRFKYWRKRIINLYKQDKQI
jgi:hypothetical protein